MRQELSAPAHRRARKGLALGLSLALAACGGSVFGLDDDGTQEVRVRMQVAEGTPEITFLVTNQFGVQPLSDGSIEVRMRSADTITTRLPLDQKFLTGDQRRVFFQLIDRQEVDSQILYSVWLDDRQVQTEDHGPEDPPLQVLYMFGSGIVATDQITVN